MKVRKNRIKLYCIILMRGPGDNVEWWGLHAALTLWVLSYYPCSSVTQGGMMKSISITKERPKQLTLRLPESLHERLIAGARVEGVPLNTFCMYLLTEGITLREVKTAQTT